MSGSFATGAGGGGGASTFFSTGGGGGGGGASTSFGAASCGVADHSSASAETFSFSRFQWMPQVRASISSTCAMIARTNARTSPGWGGGANSKRSVLAGIAAGYLTTWTDSPTRCTPARWSLSITFTTFS